MPLSAGTRLGAYEIVAALGAGGMGEVYRATDTRLKRQVAVKILPPGLATEPERLARFQREAQLLAALNHPRIAAIYGLEAAGGSDALVMELVEGEDLAQRIARGALPLAEALIIARQIVEALEAAHEQGIIHRDLKPANIKLRPDGSVKVLDFGLAKMIDAQPAGGASPLSPTLTNAGMTGEGTLVGTAAYMSPEQVRGRPADKRSDVWAFGCVLFEMLTGRRPFGGETIAEVLAGVLKSDPDWGGLPADTPQAIRRLLRRTLAKDETQRLNAIADARLEIDDARWEDVSGATVAVGARHRKERIAWLSAVAILALLVSVLATRARRPAPMPPQAQLDVNTPPVSDPQDLASFALSSDGQTLALAGIVDGQSQLLLRSLGSAAVQALPGTREPMHPFWSPDSRSIGFFADGELKRIDLDGRLVQPLAKATVGTGGSWNREGVILFSPYPASPLLRIAATGGQPVPATALGAGQSGHNFPQFLPDGRHFLYFAVGSPETRGVYLGQLDDTKARRLFDTDNAAVYMSGHVLFLRQGTLYAQEFDAARLELKQAPVPVSDEVLANTGYFVSVSAAAGTVAFRTGKVGRRRQFAWIDRAGRDISTVGEPDSSNPVGASPSPDGNRLALFRRGATDSDVWLLDTRRGVLSRFTTSPGEDVFPIWSRDGRHIAYMSNRDGCCAVYQKTTDGPEVEQLLLPRHPEETFPLDWSPDGRLLVFQRRSVKTGWDILALPLGGGGEPSPVIQTSSDEREARLSPDGKWIAYLSNTSGRGEVYAQAFPTQGVRMQVSSAGGGQVQWRSDGRELYYVALDGRLMAVPVRAGADDRTIDVGAPVPLFTAHIGRASDVVQYIASADGQRFLMNTILQDGSPTPIRLVMNWTPPRH